MSTITNTSFEIRLEPSGKQIEAKEGQTLLDAMIRNGIQVPYGCRQGNCSACKAQVLEGDYELMDRTSEFSLLSFERDQGYVLLCSTVAESDLVVEIEEEEEEEGIQTFPVYDYVAEVVDQIPATQDIHIIRLRLEEPQQLAYAAGQYVEVNIPGSEVIRAYSMATSSSSTETIELHVKRVPNGIGSTYMCDLKVGDKVTGSGPYGRMQLRDKNKDLIFVAGGSGMAPIKSLIEELFSAPYNQQAWFFYGARTPKDLYLVEEWKELEKRYPNFRFIPALSDCSEQENWTGDTGYIADVVARYMGEMSKMDAYLCGPPILIETTMKALCEKGIRRSHIFYDEF